MVVYLSRGALRLPAARLLTNSRLCVNLAFKIWILLGVNVATTVYIYAITVQHCQAGRPCYRYGMICHTGIH